MPARDWKFRVEDILEAIDEIRQLTRGMAYSTFCTDKRTVKAVLYNMAVIGEAARRVPPDVNTYYWLIWHAPTDWDDLKEFLPKAAQAGIEVWVYLVPPSESPPMYGSQYSEPFRLDYRRWAEEIARLSLKHRNLTAWVIDDFYANHEFFTPAYLREAQARSKAINPRLAFLPLMYFPEMRPKFVEDYRSVIDGVVVAYLQDREEIERTWAILNDADVPPTSEISYPWDKSGPR